MKFFKRAAAVAVAVSMLGALGAPAFAFSTPQNQIQAIPAQIVPTEQQAQKTIFEVGQRLH
ncbi:MAG: hypothetical protein ACREQ4_07355, partial [Candidatus Binataceae bacterium]